MKLKPPKQQQKNQRDIETTKFFDWKNEITGGSVIWFDETLVKKRMKNFCKVATN